MTGGRLSVWFALLAAAPGCARTPDRSALELLDFRQGGPESPPVALNEELSFYFSEDLDRSSITSDSVRILDAAGREVAGERRVRGSSLTFSPELPCAKDLSDGGLRPDSEYRVVLGGFPRPDGIRAETGALLSATLLLSFHTAKVGGLLFLDPFLGPLPLLPRMQSFEQGLLVLECGEALDPASVPQQQFELFGTGASEPERILLVARLIVNRRDHSEIVLEPTDDAALAGGRIAPDRYIIQAGERCLRTLGGRTVEPLLPKKPFKIAQARVQIDFHALTQRSSDFPRGCAGTALWSAEEGVHLRYPAAAGDGRDGEVELAAHEFDPDVRATSLTLAADEVLDLSARHGPVVLRSQTSIEIRGRLKRSGAGERDDPRKLELQSAEKVEASLSPWLERLLDPALSDQPWTVLIAGGDIVVPKGGAIEVEGPLVLVAGGWIRSADGKIVSEDDLWLTSEGGGGAYSHTGRRRNLPLVLDPPRINPLRTSLAVGLVTGPFPWQRPDDGWSTTLVGHEGMGSLSAEFLSTSELPAADGRAAAPGSSARLLVRLAIAPGRGEPWDPPRLERVELEALPSRLPVRAHD